MRLIDADELMSQLRRGHIIYEDGTENLGYTTLVFGSVIKNAPTVDAEPIKHGEWIEQTPEDIKYSWAPFICSVCSLPSGKHRTNYCPNCGAKMD